MAALEDLWKKSRADRLKDPAIQRGLDAELQRVKDSFGRLGDQAKETTAGIAYNTLVRPFVPVRGKGLGKSKLDAPTQIVSGAFDSTGKTVKLIGRVLMATGRAAKYGIRRGAAI